jgi:hypothetical protein
MLLRPITNENSGRCHPAQKRLRIRAANRALLPPVCNLGSAKPRQPTSSPKPKKTIKDDVGDPVRQEPQEGELLRAPELAQIGSSNSK